MTDGKVKCRIILTCHDDKGIILGSIVQMHEHRYFLRRHLMTTDFSVMVSDTLQRQCITKMIPTVSNDSFCRRHYNISTNLD